MLDSEPSNMQFQDCQSCFWIVVAATAVAMVTTTLMVWAPIIDDADVGSTTLFKSAVEQDNCR